MAPIKLVTPGMAWSRFLDKWDDFLLHMEKEKYGDAKNDLAEALDDKYDGALGDLPEYSIVLLRWAERLKKQGDHETAAFLIEKSAELSPSSVMVHLSLARYNLGGGQIKPGEAIGSYMDAVGALADDFPILYRGMARALSFPLAFLFLFGMLFGLVMIARYGVLFMHDFGDFLPRKRVPHWPAIPLGGVAFMLPLAASLSWQYLIAWWFLLLSIYMKRSERVIVYLFLLALVPTPLLMEKYAVLAANVSDDVLSAALEIRNGVADDEEMEILEKALEKDPDDALVQFSLAQFLQRRGQFNRAADIYKGALSEDPAAGQAAYNNLAEIYLANGDLESVYRALSLAESKGESVVEVVFNLAQYHNEAEEMLRYEEEYSRAQSIDEPRLEFLRYRAQQRKLNRIMANLPAPHSLVWERSVRGSAMAGAAGPALWHKWMGPPPGLTFAASAAALFALVFIIKILSKKWQISHRCASCGKPICLRCEPQAKDPSICSPCYYVFRGQSGVDLKVKMQKRSEAQRYRDNWSRAAMVLSLLVPGSGHIALGYAGVGSLLMALSLSLPAAWLTRFLTWPGPPAQYQGGVSGPLIVMVAGYIILSILSLLMLRPKLDVWR